jgi:hypothetical protein
MAIKTAYATIFDGYLKFPDNFLPLLPQNCDLFAAFDEEKQRVTIYFNDPSKPEISKLLDALEDLNEGLSSDEYAAPVPEHLLRRTKADRGENE